MFTACCRWSPSGCRCATHSAAPCRAGRSGAVRQISSSLQGHLTRAGGASRLLPIRARLDRPGACRTFIGSRDGCEIDCSNQHTGQISRHNLRMHPCANLTNPFVANPPVFRAAVQSNKVYPPRLSTRALAGIVARRAPADKRYWLGVARLEDSSIFTGPLYSEQL